MDSFPRRKYLWEVAVSSEMMFTKLMCEGRAERERERERERKRKRERGREREREEGRGQNSNTQIVCSRVYIRNIPKTITSNTRGSPQ
jgi:hypothetical protein